MLPDHKGRDWSYGTANQGMPMITGDTRGEEKAWNKFSPTAWKEHRFLVSRMVRQ